MMMSVCVKFPLHLASCPAQSDGENGASATRCPPITIIQTHTPMIIGTRMMMISFYCIILCHLFLRLVFISQNQGTNVCDNI